MLRFLGIIGISIFVFFVFPWFVNAMIIGSLIVLFVYLLLLRPKSTSELKRKHNRNQFNLFLLSFCVLLMLITVAASKLTLFVLLVFIVFILVNWGISVVIAFFHKSQH